MVKNWEAALNLTRNRTASGSSTADLANIIRSVHQQAVTQRFAQLIDRISTLIVTTRSGAAIICLHREATFRDSSFSGASRRNPPISLALLSRKIRCRERAGGVRYAREV